MAWPTHQNAEIGVIKTATFDLDIAPDYFKALKIDKKRANAIVKQVINIMNLHLSGLYVDDIKVCRDILQEFDDNELLFALISFYALAAKSAIDKSK